MKLVSTAAIALVGATLSWPASSASLEGHVAEFELRRDGAVVAQGKGTVGSDSVFSSSTENSWTYRKEVSLGDASRPAVRTSGTLSTGFAVELGLKDVGESLSVDAKADFTEHAAHDTFTVSGETIDLPNVNGWSLRDGGAATRTGDGWRYEAVNDTKRLSLTVHVRPREL